MLAVSWSLFHVQALSGSSCLIDVALWSTKLKHRVMLSWHSKKIIVHANNGLFTEKTWWWYTTVADFCIYNYMLWYFSMKTVMLFLTIMLVGTGWTFVKHIFSDKEKKLFLVAIPLQVLVYVARVSSDIILEYIRCCWVTAFTTINQSNYTVSCSY